ncbi:TrkH family potassium uptake protein [Megamonas hypermegale]|uniref:TrkH family potassium uptake protein n=1 Tax=Megamonas hypermegale TaxID=158847 RepID=UPI0026EBE8FC|nr:potassium transporter TrkG [Megamonas hypermegale]
MMKFFHNLNPYQIVLLSYGAIIMIGTFLLMLPISVKGIPPLTFIDALFMSASSVCVSGLSIFDMGANFSIFGQIVIIILVQIGALGIMTITTILAVIMGRRIQLRDRLLIQESLQRWSVAGVVRLVIVIVKMTFIFEFIGGFILTVIFWQDYGFAAIYYGFWHATSAFCNAGFDILGGSNISNYILNPLFNAVLFIEVVCGGLGFAVLLDIWQNRYWKKFGINTKIVLATTAILILIGTVFIFILEYGNEGTLAPYNILEKIMASLFMASMSRTSGFSMLDMNALTEPTLLFIMFLMFIGGSPASTGGGIKTTTIAVIFAAIWSLIRGREDVVIFERTVPPIIIFRALSIFFVSASVVFLTTMFLCLTEDIPLGKIFFEAVSMFSTVGLPTGTVSEMQPFSRVVIIFVMLMGRIGIISFGMALVVRRKKTKIRYPEDKFIIG